MPDVNTPFAIEVMKGVNNAIKALDYDLMIYTGGDFRKRKAASQEQHYVSLLNNGVTDGVIVVAPVATKFTTANPIIAIDPNSSMPEYTSITSTNREGALETMKHLIDKGHKRICFFTL